MPDLEERVAALEAAVAMLTSKLVASGDISIDDARRQADLQWKTRVAEARRAGRETPLKRGSDCPEHGGILLWLGNGDLMCLQGHFYRLPGWSPAEPAASSRRRRAKAKPEGTPGAT